MELVEARNAPIFTLSVMLCRGRKIVTSWSANRNETFLLRIIYVSNWLFTSRIHQMAYLGKAYATSVR